MRVSDAVFRVELDETLKAQGITKKKDRNALISLAIENIPEDRRDDYLDDELNKSFDYQEERREEKRIPLESEEQKKVVAWFRLNYPDKIIMMVRNDGHRTQAEKTEQVLLGLHKGASDLFIPRFGIWLEMKRIKNSKLSEEQRRFGNEVASNGYYFIVGYGADDAIEKILAVIEK